MTVTRIDGPEDGPEDGGAIDALWADLSTAASKLRGRRRIVDLFSEDPARFETFSATFDDLLLDYSKELMDRRARALLFKLAGAVDLDAWRRKMLSGEIVNGTERRAARHNILRAASPPLAGVADMREQFLDFAQAVRRGERLGVGSKQFTDIVNIGIGGSYLGPRLAAEALAPFADGPRIHFVANVDPWDFHRAVDGLDPARTLFICASKSFGTQETVLNLRLAIDWLTARLGPEAVARQICAVTARPDAARKFGVAPENIFQIWDWAGGRFSVWSSMGLCAAIRIGRRAFEAFLEGGAEMDRHFASAPIERNLPTLAALVGVWRRNALGASAYVVSPYEQRLAALPEYIQQLEMESNGKRVRRDGRPVARATAPIVLGGAGANTQHSFFQQLHQSPDGAPVDFLVGVETTTPSQHAHNVLAANCLAQAKALMTGLDLDQARETLRARGLPRDEVERLAPHLVCPGDRPSTTLMYRRLDPKTLGRLIAFYEHKTFVQGVLWEVECFDQWGVELGKRLADGLLDRMDADGRWGGEDPSTRGLLAWRRRTLDDEC